MREGEGGSRQCSVREVAVIWMGGGSDLYGWAVPLAAASYAVYRCVGGGADGGTLAVACVGEAPTVIRMGGTRSDSYGRHPH